MKEDILVRIPNLRWVIAVLLLAATTINYVDRLTLSVVIADIRTGFSLTEQDYAHIVNLFLIAYAVMYGVSGCIVDRLGTRRGFGVFVFIWSAAQMLHGFCRDKWALTSCRVLLGATESGNFPAAVKAVGEWFPSRQRAIAVGIFNAGSSLGAILAAPLAAYVTIRYGWRTAFFFTGASGIVWLLLWRLFYRQPSRNAPAENIDAKSNASWRDVLLSRPCVTLVVLRFLTDPVIYFVMFWLPEYLRNEGGFDLAMAGQYGWIAFVFGDAGYILGGLLSGYLIGRGWSLSRARKCAMAVAASLLPAAMFGAFAPSAHAATAVTALVIFGHAFWIANLMTLPTDLFRPGEVGRAAGFSGAAGALGGVFANLGAGFLVSHFSYASLFVLTGVLHPFAAILLYRLLPAQCFRDAHSRRVCVSA